MSTAPAYSLDVGFVLIAEDNPADVCLIRMALEKHGVLFRVHLVADGEAAMNFVQELELEAGSLAQRPMLAVLDLNLPRIGGDQVLRVLRSSTKWRDVPVIMMSSSISSRDEEEAMSLGATAYFSKPSELEKFLELGSLVKSVLPRAQFTNA